MVSWILLINVVEFIYSLTTTFSFGKYYIINENVIPTIVTIYCIEHLTYQSHNPSQKKSLVFLTDPVSLPTPRLDGMWIPVGLFSNYSVLTGVSISVL